MRLTPHLEKIMLRRIATPVIVEAKTGMFDRLRGLLREMVPVGLLETRFHTFLPRILKLIEFPLSKWKEIKTFNMVATVLTPNLIEEIAQWSEVEKIYPDYLKWALKAVPSEGIFKDYKEGVFTTTYWTKRMLGLDRANEQGLTGRGVNVAVIDTGSRVTHPQLRGVRALTAMPEKGGSGKDANGHGSWCVACVGGTHEIDRRYNAPVEGMAPSCSLYSIQALGFIIGTGTSSDIIQGMEMCIGLGVKVVSMSLGSEDAPKDEDNPEAKAINKLVERGIIPCVAAGNSGPAPRTIGSPGSCLNSLTVGSISPFTGAVSQFSSRGPTAWDGFVKPDVMAPGERISSALVGFLDEMVDPTQKRFGPISGTSMATPHIAGLVACMAQMYKERVGKELTVEEIKAMMRTLGHTKTNLNGWGSLDWSMVEEWCSSQYGITL